MGLGVRAWGIVLREGIKHHEHALPNISVFLFGFNETRLTFLWANWKLPDARVKHSYIPNCLTLSV